MLASTTTGMPPDTVMLKLPVLPEVTHCALTDARGTGVGSRIAKGTDHPLRLAESAHSASLEPTAVSAPTVPPKFTEPLVASMKLGMAFAPLCTSVGKAKFHHLKPRIGAPLMGSLPFLVELEM